jgi:hypothetical protein
MLSPPKAAQLIVKPLIRSARVALLSSASDDLAEIDAVSEPSKIDPEWVFDLRSDRIPGGSRNYSDLMKSTV